MNSGEMPQPPIAQQDQQDAGKPAGRDGKEEFCPEDGVIAESGSNPRTQKRLPSRLTRGKTKRVLKVDINSPTTERLIKLTMFTHYGNRTVKQADAR